MNQIKVTAQYPKFPWFSHPQSPSGSPGRSESSPCKGCSRHSRVIGQLVGAVVSHYVDVVTGVLPFDVGTTRGPGSNGRIDYPGYGMIEVVGDTPGLRAALCAFSDAGVPGFYDNGLAGGSYGADTVGRLIGKDLKETMSNVDRILNIDIFTDDDVEFQNGVTLSSAYPPDEHGRVPRIDLFQRQRTARTVRNREFLAQKAVELLRVLGATKVHRINKPPFVIHSHSSMRMGISAMDSVLDSNGEARLVKRLFVADNSALANGIGGPNPTLTTQAIATHTAEKLFRMYFDGDPWVLKESPVCSTDPAITLAMTGFVSGEPLLCKKPNPEEDAMKKLQEEDQ